ncbi:tRNA (N6-isopentenyl adenosine(37)-C2)-methylthiotransferase MiaB [bacterium]|nr:tRNA (N6-isopentenyl adenosine(37)-C2)-methylthiotransferase MiaB [bacterium]
MAKKFFLHTFGCQMNVYDSSRLADVLRDRGWHKTLVVGQADLLIANTCTVRQLAEEKAFSLIGRWAKLKKENPDIIIGMIGCLAQHLGDLAFRRAPVIDFLAGPRALAAVPDLAEQARFKKHQSEYRVYDFEKSCSRTVHKTRISDSVAVMDGCDQYCTYCAVPQARGREKSRSIDKIVEEVKRKIDGGAREITLLGQNVTRFGMEDDSGKTLTDLLYKLGSVPGLLRLRFLTGHPKAFTDSLIQAMFEIPVVCEALHLPIQSGSDGILKKMNRGYTTLDYQTVIEKTRQKIPDLILTTDLIVGFPGETEKDFQATLAIVDACQFDMAFCFKYSPRKGTAAEKMPDQISKAEKERRLDILMQQFKRIAMRKKSAWIGKILPVLIEGRDPKTEKKLQGRTRGNMIVNLDGPAAWIGREVAVEIVAAGSWSLLGDAVKNQKMTPSQVNA